MMGDVEPQPHQVFPASWHGEDLFYVSKPGPPLIVERVAQILARMDNLRKETVVNRDKVRHVMCRP